MGQTATRFPATPIGDLMRRVLCECAARWAAVQAEPEPYQHHIWIHARWAERQRYGPEWSPREWLFPACDGPLPDSLGSRVRRAVGRLAEMGLVEPGRPFERMTHLKPTPAGERVAAEIAAAMRAENGGAGS
jgi:hypothetical protein